MFEVSLAYTEASLSQLVLGPAYWMFILIGQFWQLSKETLDSSPLAHFDEVCSGPVRGKGISCRSFGAADAIIDETLICCWLDVRSYIRRAVVLWWPVRSYISFSNTFAANSWVAPVARRLWFVLPWIPAFSHTIFTTVARKCRPQCCMVNQKADSSVGTR